MSKMQMILVRSRKLMFVGVPRRLSHLEVAEAVKGVCVWDELWVFGSGIGCEAYVRIFWQTRAVRQRNGALHNAVESD